jgi:Asp-tRNA(Asn)/Glu-tRNA(Gln) amidotransferase A subunit family amidase
MDEFAYCEPPATKNPRDLARTPGGSSGGSAAAVAADMGDFAVGSQTLQSTIVPAAYCGIVGFKPTYGRWAFDGIPLSRSIDTVGFFAPTIGALDEALSPVGQRNRADRPRRIGIPAAWGMRAHTDGWQRFARHARLVGSGDLELVRCEVPWNTDGSWWASAVGDLVRREMSDAHAAWFADYRHLYRPRTAAAIELGSAIDDQRLNQFRQAQRAMSDALDEQMAELDLDCYMCPSVCGVAPVGYDITGDSWMTCFWSFAGLPCLSLPIIDPDERRCLEPSSSSAAATTTTLSERSESRSRSSSHDRSRRSVRGGASILPRKNRPARDRHFGVL